MAACRVYGPGARPTARRPGPARQGPRRRCVASHRLRSWSRSSTGSPSGPLRAASRDDCSSINADRPCTSASLGTSVASIRPSRSASSHSAGRIQSVTRGRGVALVEQQVDHPRARPPAGSLAPTGSGSSSAAPASARVRLARTTRCATVASEVRNAPGDLPRAQPADQLEGQRGLRLRCQRRVAADEHQPQHVVLDMVDGGVDVDRRSDLASLIAGDARRSPVPPLAAAELVDGAALGGRHQPRRRVVAGCPISGHCASAATIASWARSSASPTSRTIRTRAGDQPRRLQPPDGLDDLPGGLLAHVLIRPPESRSANLTATAAIARRRAVGFARTVPNSRLPRRIRRGRRQHPAVRGGLGAVQPASSAGGSPIWRSSQLPFHSGQ